VLAGCGNEYRPVVSAINPVGPAQQPTKYAVAISSTSPTTLGLITIVDVSGDTVLTTPQIQSNPSYFVLNTSGTEGYTVNAAGQFDFFGTSNPTSLITSNIGQTTLPVNANPVTLSAFTPASASSAVFIPQVATSTISALNAGSAALYDSVAVGANPIYVVGADNTPRVYALSQGATPGTSTGTAASIETTTTNSLSVSATIPVGINPTYGVMTADDRRAYILNKGSGTVSVINVVNNALDSTTPTIALPAISIGGGATVAASPVWAGFSPTTSELIVLNQGDGIHPGSLSIISIPLCNPAATINNPNCNAANPADATGFGQIVATVPVGVNPVMVSVLQDGSTAWVANQGNATTQGSVTAVNLTSGTVAATIAGIAPPGAPTTANAAYVFGHPNSISATTGTPTGKVYVTSGDSNYLTIIYTDTNTVQSHITLQGTGVRVLVTAP
jgi:DNA-binding beta-propeller fold protein YncE